MPRQIAIFTCRMFVCGNATVWVLKADPVHRTLGIPIDKVREAWCSR